jgi:hypothetical protein
MIAGPVRSDGGRPSPGDQHRRLAGEAAVPIVLRDLERRDTEFLAARALSEIGPVGERARQAIEQARAGRYWADLAAGPRG